MTAGNLALLQSYSQQFLKAQIYCYGQYLFITTDF